MGSAAASTRAAVSPLPDIIGLGGALAGLIGGLAMALVAALISFVERQDIWREAKAIASVLLGAQAAAQPGFAVRPVLIGTLIHLITAMLLGALFGIVIRRWLQLPSDFGIPVVAGLAYGLLIWLVAYFVALPVVDPWLLDSYAPAFIVQHIVYGTVTGLGYAWLRPSPYDASE
jgi:uncharacterized YccA/Bax inhibitor family protein